MKFLSSLATLALGLVIGFAPIAAVAASSVPLNTLPVNSSPAGTDLIPDLPNGSGTLEGLTLTSLETWLAGEISGLPNVGSGHTLCNVTGSSAQPTDQSLSACLDYAFGSTRGALLERGASGWTLIAPGSSGNVLTSNGDGADPSYQAAAGGDCTPSASAGDAKAPGCIGVPQSGGAFKTANYTTTAADVGGEIVLNCSAACTATVATNAAVPVAVGQVMDITNVGSAADTISSSDTLEAASAGTIVTGSVSLPVGATAFLHKLGATTWLVSGAQGSNLLTPCTVVSGSSTSQVVLTIPASGYTNLQIKFTGYVLDSGSREDAMPMAFNGDTTSSDYQGPFYWYAGIVDGTGSQSGAQTFLTSYGASGCSPAGTEGSNTTPIACTMDILGYQQTTWPIVFHVESYMMNTQNSRILYDGATWAPGTHAAVTSVTITAGSNSGSTLTPKDFAPYSTFCVYGN